VQKYKLILSYDGTNYGGWQVQPNATSIQTLVQNALEIALRTTVALTGAGRTDAGVHAIGQVAHFTTIDMVDCYRLQASLNGLLPLDIRVYSIQPVSIDFHSRYSAISKTYHYRFHLNKVLDPFKRLYTTHIPYKIDLPLLKEASQYFIGTHDFTSFANEAHKGSASKDAIRTLKRLDIVEEKDEVRLEFEADGFLYKMVRNITGTLLEIATHKILIEDIPEIFSAKDRKKAGRTAPPQGLFLVRVHYP
jgi:tRNA pseudouridine38-40 synthase